MNDLAQAGRLEPLTPTAREVANLLAQAARSLDDGRKAIAGGLSADWQFMIVYGAVLSLAAAVVHAAGFRPRGRGHHATLFEALEIIIPQLTRKARFFDRCRRKRNILMYEAPRKVTSDQVARIFSRAKAFDRFVRRWLGKNHPALVSPRRSP